MTVVWMHNFHICVSRVWVHKSRMYEIAEKGVSILICVANRPAEGSTASATQSIFEHLLNTAFHSNTFLFQISQLV